MENPPSTSSPGSLPPPVDPELALKMAANSDAELQDMFASPEDWKPEALYAARAELQHRNLPIRSPEEETTLHEEATIFPAAAATLPEEAATSSLPEDLPVRAGMTCVQHPNLPATQQCRRCGGYVCPTCDFAFPGNVHFCPACVSQADDGISPRRKKFMIWSYVLAVWSTVGMTCLVSGVMSGMAQTEADRMALGWVLLIFVLGPAITGFSLGMATRRKQGVNPTAVWIAIIWNVVLVVSFVLLLVIGLATK